MATYNLSSNQEHRIQYDEAHYRYFSEQISAHLDGNPDNIHLIDDRTFEDWYNIELEDVDDKEEAYARAYDQFKKCIKAQKEVKTMETINYDAAFDAFKADAFEQSVLAATRAAEKEQTWHVELFADGTYRLLAQIELGDRYEEQGLTLVVPALNEEDYAADDPDARFFGNALEEFTEIYTETLYGRLNP